MKWTADQLDQFNRRRSADGALTSASIRPPSNARKALGRDQRDILPSETQIQISVAEHLRHCAAPNVYWFHPANGEHRDPRTAAKLKAFGVRPGAPDLILLIRGKFFALELKRDDGRLSQVQKVAHREIEAAGGFVASAHSVDDALEILKRWGALKPDTSLRPSAQTAIEIGDAA